eukprot:TRINITY_DN37046_c0_g1_i1.p1 TRINITY_DN37046_c0_g1~~TRINITY_DN37046_c0_g1_i1.p1  ORF type:complete len:130 (-),score=22.32 TRINITY_DN37046_c0_g1_i1:73-462(-)
MTVLDHVDASSSSSVTRAVEAFDEGVGESSLQKLRNLAAWYLPAVFLCRLVLRCDSAVGSLHWAILMVLEDSLSLTSFAMALLYLHRSKGAPLVALTKHMAQQFTPAGASGSADALAGSRPIRLFHFAL